jgi:hypothetical protein
LTKKPGIFNTTEMKLPYEILNLVFEYNNNNFYEKWNYYFVNHIFIKKINKNSFYKIENVNKHKQKYFSELISKHDTITIIHKIFIHNKLIMYIENYCDYEFYNDNSCNYENYNDNFYIIHKFELKNKNGRHNEYRDDFRYVPILNNSTYYKGDLLYNVGLNNYISYYYDHEFDIIYFGNLETLYTRPFITLYKN